MGRKIEIEGDSPEAVALALLQMVGRAEGKIDEDGEPKGADRAWILDAYAECLEATEGLRGAFGPEDEDDDEEEDDLEEGEDGEEEDDLDKIEEDEAEEDEARGTTPAR